GGDGEGRPGQRVRAGHPRAGGRRRRRVGHGDLGGASRTGSAVDQRRHPPSVIVSPSTTHQMFRWTRLALAWARGLRTIWSMLTFDGRVAANAITSATSSGVSGVIPR